MKVFISWSGERSREVAELFKWWLKCVVQGCVPWVSTQDIASGSIWYNGIGGQLSTTTVGIICLTAENKDKPWILFEAGALTKGLSTSRIIPFLVDLQPQDIYPPLSQLNATLPDKKGVFSLISTINGQLTENQLNERTLVSVFDTFWPQFEYAFNSILVKVPDNQNHEGRGEKDILSEILITVRGFDRRIRSLENNRPVNPSSSDDISLNKTPITSSIRSRIANYFLNYSLENGRLPTVEEIADGINVSLTPDMAIFINNEKNRHVYSPSNSANDSNLDGAG